jgi:hypothetical protein
MGYFVEHYFAKQGWHNHVMGRLQLRYIHPRGQTYKGRNDMGAHILGTNQPRSLSNKGRNIQELPVRDSPVRDTITLVGLDEQRLGFPSFSSWLSTACMQIQCHDDVSPNNVSPEEKSRTFRSSDNASLGWCGPRIPIGPADRCLGTTRITFYSDCVVQWYFWWECPNYRGYYMFRIVLYKEHFTFLAQHLLSLHNTHIKPFKFRSTMLPKRKELSLSKKIKFSVKF